MAVMQSSEWIGGASKGKRRIGVLPRSWVCTIRWVMVPFTEVGKARGGPGGIGGGLKVRFEHNEFMTTDVSREST